MKGPFQSTIRARIERLTEDERKEFFGLNNREEIVCKLKEIEERRKEAAES